jgi:hypothetical protein
MFATASPFGPPIPKISSRKNAKRAREKSKLPCLCGDITWPKNQKISRRG